MGKSQFIAVLIVAFSCTVFIRTFVIEAFIVQGDSMDPTIVDGDYVFVNKLAYIKGEPERGDVIVGRAREYPYHRVVKRVVGMPGERFEMVNGDVIIRDRRNDPVAVLSEAYIVHPDDVGSSTPIKLDQKEYFALGDNRTVSIDSRELGPIDLWDIKGRAIFIFNLKSMKVRGI